jgi:glycosyltransferase involved in cell wall biosynthesis
MNKLKLEHTAILIPAYQPDKRLSTLVTDLHAAGVLHIVLVDDGSGSAYQALFKNASDISSVTLITHTENQGKGAALKSGFRTISKQLKTVKHIITADADGQHTVADILRVAKACQAYPNQFILGERNFGDDVPLRSRFGNSLTRRLFRLFYRAPVRDTQTGLRGMSVKLANTFLTIPYDRYEFELACLQTAVQSKIAFHRVDIETVYIDDNASSHFNPLVDSAKIYFVLFRYAIVAILSFVLDFVLFMMMHTIFHNVLISLLFARVMSASFNFYQNKYRVYRVKSRQKLRKEIIDYVTLAIGVFCGSYGLISLLHFSGLSILVSKVIADAILFTLSFIIQKIWVFC